MANFIPIGEPANDSERKGMRLLRDVLPDHYTVIGNFDLQLPRRKNTLEYDAVVVGEWGLYAVEIRGWGGDIYGDIRRWRLEWANVENPFIRIERKAKALRDLLVRSMDDFPDSVFCESVVFLTREDAVVHVEDERNRRLLMPGQTYEFFVDEARMYERGPGPLLDDETRQEIVDAIIPLAQEPSPLPVVPNYELECELDAEERPYCEFVGHHSLLQSRGRVRVKAYALDPLLSGERQELEYNRIMRDMEALISLEDNVYVARPHELIQDREDELIFYLVSEWVSSTTLADYVAHKDYEALEPEDHQEFRRFAKHLLQAISFMHEREIVHRNLHPKVVYLTRDGDDVPLKIADFDYARVANLRSITGELSDLGAEGYAAPEVWSEDGYDHRIDLYSAGVILFELFTGRFLFGGLSEMLRPAEVWREKRELVDDPELRDVLDLLISTEPKQRSRGLKEALELFDEAP